MTHRDSIFPQATLYCMYIVKSFSEECRELKKLEEEKAAKAYSIFIYSLSTAGKHTKMLRT